MAHRLLKLQLASAIRDAGWYAELEVAGEGWRADVLATSPDGTRRMAWEAQLAQITGAELRERTARMEASGVPVRSEEHTSELQSLMRISYAVFCLKKKKHTHIRTSTMS